MTDTYHGVTVIDSYRWLERDADPEVKAWSAAQNRYARAFLDAQPMRAALQSQLAKLYGSSSSLYTALRYRSGVLFALKSQPPKEQPLLVWMKSADDPAAEKVVVDPNQIDAKGGTEIDFYEPSHNGKLVAVSLSQGGSESGDVHVYDASTGKPLADVVPHVNNGTAGGSVAWKQDDTGFYYTRYPHAGERPPADLAFYQQVWFHKLGTPISVDTYSLGKDFPRIAEILLSTSPDGRYVLAQMANGDGGEFAHYLLGPDGQWTQITHLADSVTQAIFGGNDSLWLVSRQGSPMGKVLRLPFSKPFKLRLRTAREVIDAGRGDADDKATVLIAMLRAADIPSRIRYIELRGEILRGLTSNVASAARPVAEIWVGDRWLSTDTYIFDAAYMAAARQRLKDQGWEWGYGIHRDGHAIWTGAEDAWLGGMPTSSDPMVIEDLGLFNDPMELLSSPAWLNAHTRLARAVQWNVLAPMMEKVVRELRQEASSGPPAPAPAPRRIS